MNPTIASIDYGKVNVTAYRFCAKPLTGLTPIPESPFTGRDNRLFAVDVDVRVLGDNFIPAYTEGDNRMVVATDSMKNFVLKKALEFDGATLEGYLDSLGRAFLEAYPEMESLRLRGKEVPFEAELVPDGEGFAASDTLFSHARGEYAVAELAFERQDEIRLTDHRCGRLELRLVKLTGSSFASFVRDEHTTLPERQDRPLYIYLNVFWRYGDVAHLLADNHARYVAAEQVRDLIAVVFHEFNSRSIQHLVHEMGKRLLARFPQLSEVSFEAQNRLWDEMYVSDADPTVKVHCDPRPPYGRIGLTMRQEA